MEYYKKVYIKSEADLPKENGTYFVKIKTPPFTQELAAVGFIWENDREHINGFWLNKVDWYLLPVPAPEIQMLGERPKIICLCGSMRFIKEFHEQEERLSLQRVIVLKPGVNTKDAQRTDNLKVYKPMLDELHFRKIDLCDEVFVINKDGYIGESTRNEINYALKIGKPVKYMVP